MKKSKEEIVEDIKDFLEDNVDLIVLFGILMVILVVLFAGLHGIRKKEKVMIYQEWISPDGAHYWVFPGYDGGYEIVPRFNSKGEIITDGGAAR